MYFMGKKLITIFLINYSLIHASQSLENLESNNQFSHLILMIQVGQTTEVKKLLKSNKSLINEKDSFGQSPLITVCAWSNKPALVQYLIKTGSTINSADFLGNTPLHYAQHPGIIRTLIKAGANINALNNKQETPLLKNHANHEKFFSLLEAGANPNQQANNGMTLLARLIKSRRYYMTRILLSQQATLKKIPYFPFNFALTELGIDELAEAKLLMHNIDPEKNKCFFQAMYNCDFKTAKKRLFSINDYFVFEPCPSQSKERAQERQSLSKDEPALRHTFNTPLHAALNTYNQLRKEQASLSQINEIKEIIGVIVKRDETVWHVPNRDEQIPLDMALNSKSWAELQPFLPEYTQTIMNMLDTEIEDQNVIKLVHEYSALTMNERLKLLDQTYEKRAILLDAMKRNNESCVIQ